MTPPGALSNALDAAVLAAPTVDPEDPNAAQGSWRFTPDSLVFQGHFDGAPILPAMLQIMAGERVAAALFGEPRALLGVDRARFTDKIGPGQTMTALAKRTGPDRVQIAASVDAAPASSFTLLFQAMES